MTDPYLFRDTRLPFDPDMKFWGRHLQSGERVLWEGRPGFSFVLDRQAAKLCLPALVAVIAYGLDLSGISVFSLLGLPGSAQTIDTRSLVFMGLILAYLIGYISFFSLTLPNFMRYALTNRRLLIRRTLPWPTFQSVRLTPSTPVLHDGRDPGTIVFGETYAHYGDFKTAAKAVGFKNIDAPRKVMKMIERVKEGKL